MGVFCALSCCFVFAGVLILWCVSGYGSGVDEDVSAIRVPYPVGFIYLMN